MKRSTISNISVKIGTKFHYTIADSNALWEVKSKVSSTVWRAEVINDLDYNGQQKVFSTQEIFAILSWENSLNSMKQNGEKEWFDCIKKYNLKPGDFVHDINSSRTYAWRCELLADGKVKRIGLVGTPESYLIPAIHYNVGGGDVEIWKGAVRNIEEDEPTVWGNRPLDFAELNGDFSWRDKQVNTQVMKLPEITPDVLKKKQQLETLHKITNDFQSGRIDIEQLKIQTSKL